MARPLFIYPEYASGATVAATGMAAGQSAADILQANEDTYISPAVASLTITIDMLTAQAYGCLGLAGENLNGVTLEIRGSSDNFAASNIQISAPEAISGFIAGWRPFVPATCRYWRLIITGATTATRIYHAAFCPIRLLPFLNSGDPDRCQTETNHIISPQGHFLGSQKIKSEWKFNLEWGVVMSVPYQSFLAWKQACVDDPKAFFYVPDSAISSCYFGYTDQGFTFSAPVKDGKRTLIPIPFTSRKP
jgi:hypothetical protein